MRASLKLAGLVFLAIASCWSQQSGSQKADIPTLLDELRSDDAATRYQAYQQLRIDPVALRNPKVRTALLELLDREYREFDLRVHEAQRSPKTVKNEEGDDSPEYMDELVSTVESFADLHDPHQICLLVRTGYMPTSTSAGENALRVKAALPCVMGMADDDFMLNRARAAAVAVRLLTVKQALDPNTVRETEQLIVHALHDSDEAVRSSTVDALGNYGTEDMVPALSQVAESDPAVSRTKHTFWIREDAAKAIAAIQNRVGQHQQ